MPVQRAGRRLMMALAACLAACGPNGNTIGSQTPPTPTDASVTIAAPAENVEPSAAAPAEPPLDLKGVKRWLDDPRLAEVAKQLASDHPLAAARAAHEARLLAEKSGAPSSDRAALAYVEGLLFARVGVPEAAFAAFRSSAALDTPLAGHALLRSVEHAAALGRHEQAALIAAGIDRARVPTLGIDLAVVESVARTGALEEITAIVTRLFLAGVPRRPGWAAHALRVTKALARRQGPEFARLALSLAGRVRFDSLRGRGSDDAEKLAPDIASRLPAAERDAERSPSEETMIERGRRMADAEQSKRALSLLDKIAKRSAGKLSKEAACTLAIGRGKALGAVGRKREAFDQLNAGAGHCEGESLAEVLFSSGKAGLRSHLYVEAAALYGRLESAFPKHAYADDARVEGARAELEAGRREQFNKLLDSVAEDYPEGDRTGDGLFARAMDAMERRAWSEARSALEKGNKRGLERVYKRSGRFSYFLGRVLLEMGDQAAGLAQLDATLVRAPLTYYAALAAARLEALESGRPARVMSAALAAAPTLPAAELPASKADDPRVQAAMLLAGVGDPRGVDDALAVLGVRDRTAEPAWYLFGARLLAKAGDEQAAHALLRTARERDVAKGRFDLDLLVHELPRGHAREAWELAFPRLFRREVEKASAETGVPTAFVYAIMREESSFLPRALSHADAHGLMQVIPATGASLARSLGLKFSNKLLYEPEANVRMGARYLAGLRKKFHSVKPLVCAGYNAGPGAPAKWLEERPEWDLDLWVERIPYTETRDYVKRVWASYFAYQVLYESGALGEIALVGSKVPAALKDLD